MSLYSFSVNAQVSDVDKVQGDLKSKTEVKKEGWTKQGTLNIGLNQATLQNWAAGGERASLAINGVFNGFATKINGNKIWENTLDLFYGMNYVASNNFDGRKIDDRIDFSSRYGLQPRSWLNKPFLKNTYLMGLARLQSQFSKGFNYADPLWKTANNGDGISNFLSPLYVTLAIGAEYRPNDNFNLFISPLAARIIAASTKYTTLSLDGAFGIPYNKTMSFQLGAYLSSRYQTHLSKNIDYRTRLDLYSNYLKEPQNIDILWDNFMAMKLGKNISAGLGLTFVYDHDIPGQRDENGDLGPLGWTQLKQVLSLGFNYKFN